MTNSPNCPSIAFVRTWVNLAGEPVPAEVQQRLTEETKHIQAWQHLRHVGWDLSTPRGVKTYYLQSQSCTSWFVSEELAGWCQCEEQVPIYVTTWRVELPWGGTRLEYGERQKVCRCLYPLKRDEQDAGEEHAQKRIPAGVRTVDYVL